MEMCIIDTPLIECPKLDLWIKREDLCCPEGPNFSKTRGVFAHITKRPESLIGVLDTAHSQGGWAVAKACKLLKKSCWLYYPQRKREPISIKPQQRAAEKLGAQLKPLPAGRSAILYHRARADVESAHGYMMPNALKLAETVEETSLEVQRTKLPKVDTVLVSASSGTITAGVCQGLTFCDWSGKLIVHLGYSRPIAALRNYIERMSIPFGPRLEFVDEGYTYADKAKDCGVPSPCPMNEYYDLKAWSWWVREGRVNNNPALFWNIG